MGNGLTYTLAAVAAGGLLSATIAGVGWWRLRKATAAACAHLVDLTERSMTAAAECERPLSAFGPLAGSIVRLQHWLGEHCQRIQGLEQAQIASEVRASRAAAENQKLRLLFQAIPEPIIAIDEYEELTLSNASAREILDLPEADAATSSPEKRALASLTQSEKLVSLLAATIHHKSNTPRIEEIDLVDPQGQTHSFRVTATKLASPKREGLTGAVAVMHDIAEQRLLQKRNAEFVSSVSHEMKTPLAGIRAYVELLVDGDAEDEATREEFLGIISGQADRLQRLVENLLNLARIEAGVVQVHKKQQSLNEILEEAFRVVQPAAEGKDIHLVSDLSPLYLGVLADKDMLLQAAINLLSNAIKYTHAGGTVTLRSRLENDQIRFEVSDTGVGLGPEDCQKVFEKFYRVNKDKNMAAGTGLGLPLAKHIVEDVHRGSLTVQSVLGEGSTFSVSLSAASQHN